MKARIKLQKLFIFLLVILSGCATLESAGHKYLMRGQVLEVTDGVAYLCIGSKDGAAVGQEYVVYRSEKEWHPGSKYKPFKYKRVEIGKIRIQEIVDEHYATAKILKGDVKENDLAELRP
jgi:hypothetical protein